MLQQVREDAASTSQTIEVTPSFSRRMPFSTGNAKRQNRYDESFQAASVQVKN